MVPRRPASVSVGEEDDDRLLKLNLVGSTLGRMIEIFGLEMGWTLGWTLESAPPGRVLCVPCMRWQGCNALAGVQLLFCKGAWQQLRSVVDIIFGEEVETQKSSCVGFFNLSGISLER